MTSFSKTRVILVQLLCLGLIFSIIIVSWYPEKDTTPEQVSFDPKQTTSQLDIEQMATEKGYLYESQLLFFAQEFLTNYYGKNEAAKKQVDSLLQGTKNSLVSSLQYLEQDKNAEQKPALTSLERKKFIMSLWLEESAAQEKLCYHLIDRKDFEESPALRSVDEMLLRKCDNLANITTEPVAPLKLEEYEILKNQLGWFAGVFQTTLLAERTDVFNQTLSDAKAATISLLKIGLIILAIVLASIISASTLTVKILKKSLIFRFTQASIPTPLILETFTLYLAAMLSLPLGLKLLKNFDITLNPLMVNLFGISSLVLLVWWPTLCKAQTKDVEQSFGLAPAGSISLTIRNLCAGPYGYLAAIVPLIIFMGLYSIILDFLGVQPSDGAHPIVPVISETKSQITLYAIFFMAVVVAPFVEEIMFRGVFYSWLRSRCSISASIAISALVFASVHPQGPIGLLPLSLIGAVLAFLREWRGSLVSPMLAHACFNAGTLALAMGILR